MGTLEQGRLAGKAGRAIFFISSFFFFVVLEFELRAC
jgi:hypothetical protein